MSPSDSHALTYDRFNPWKSIVHFTSVLEHLWPDQQRHFLELMTAHFEELAYADKSTEGLTQAFTQYHAEAISSAGRNAALSEATFQLLANVAKVAHLAIDCNQEWQQIYPVSVQYDRNNKKNYYWGWIIKEYVDNSKKIQRYFTKGQIVIPLEVQLKPTILLGLQRLTVMRLQEAGGTMEMLLSPDLIYALILFAREWDIPLLMQDVSRLLTRIDLKAASWKEALVRYRGLDEVIKAQPLVEEELVFPHHDTTCKASPFFDDENPYRSINNFAARCCTLSPAGQQLFFAKVRHHFSGASKELQQPISEEDERQFVEVGLPLLLSSMQLSKEGMGQLLFSIQTVARRTFKLHDSWAVYHVCNEIAGSSVTQRGWLPGPNRDSVKASSSKGKEKGERAETPWTAPLIERTIKGTRRLPFSLLAGCHPTKKTPPHELILALLHIEAVSPGTPREPIEQGIQQALKETERSAEMSAALLRHINIPTIRTCIETVGPSLLRPRFGGSISDEQYLDFMEMRMKDCSHPECLKDAFPPSKKTDHLLDRFKTSKASREQKMLIDSYFYQRLLEKMPSTLQEWLKELWNPYSDCSSYKDDQIRQKLQGYIDDIQPLLKTLKKPDIAELTNRAGCGEKRNDLVKKLEQLYPHLIIAVARESFAETFQELGELATTLFDLIEQTSEHGLFYFDSNPSFAQSHPLEEKAFLKGSDFLRSDQYIRWHKIYMHHLPLEQPAETFDREYILPYKIKQKTIAAFLTSLSKEVDSSQEMTFLKACLEDFYNNPKNLPIKEMNSVHMRDLQHLASFLDGDHFKELSNDEPSLKDFHNYITNFLKSQKKLEINIKKLETFQEKFDVPDFIAQCWEPIHLEKGVPSRATLYQIRNTSENRELGNYIFDNDNSVKCALFLQQSNVTQWMKDNTEPYLIHSLKEAIATTSFRLSTLLNIHSILVKFKDKVQDEKCHQFLKKSLIEIGLIIKFKFDEAGYKILLNSVSDIGKDLNLKQIQQLHNAVRADLFSKDLVQNELRHAPQILNIHFILITLKDEFQDQDSQEFIKKTLIAVGCAMDAGFNKTDSTYQDLVNYVRQIGADLTMEQIERLQNVMNADSFTSSLPEGHLQHTPEIFNEALQSQGSCSIM